MSTVMGPDTDTAIARSDPRLTRLQIVTEDEQEAEIGSLVVSVRSLARRVIYRHVRSERLVCREDAEDILSIVSLRLVTKLRAIACRLEEPVEYFDDYVATVAYHALSDYLRQRYPVRARLNNRLRYALTHDSRIALWMDAEGRQACGLAEWRGSLLAISATVSVPADLRSALLDRDRPADALATLFRSLGTPVSYDALLDALATAGGVTDVRTETIAAREAPAVELLESRERVELLWREVRQLRPMQRKALLLNLRDVRTHALGLFLLTGVATAREVAESLEMTLRDLAEIWNDLPFDDLRIASMLQLTRQQVINLRKCARERLSRRLSR